MFDTMNSVLSSMQRQVEVLHQMLVERALEQVSLKLESMPSLDVSSRLNFSSLIEQVGKNSTEAGTILQSNGSPVAVIFSTEQYQTVNAIIKFIPFVIQNMHDAMKHRIEFKEKLQHASVEIFNITGAVLNPLPLFILIGTVATLAGAFLFGKKYHEVENDQTKLKSRMSYIAPGALLALGVSALAFTVYGASLASSICFDLAKGFSAFPE